MKEAPSFSLGVPEACRRELIRLQDRRLVFSFAGLLGMATLVYVLKWSSTYFITAFYLMMALPSLFSWPKERRKQWQYELSRESVKVLWLQNKGKMWDWKEIDWRISPIIGVERTEWRGLPALRLLCDVKNAKYHPEWLIIYAPEDTERVETQLLPLIETYRHQYRQVLMADRLRQ